MTGRRSGCRGSVAPACLTGGGQFARYASVAGTETALSALSQLGISPESSAIRLGPARPLGSILSVDSGMTEVSVGPA